MVLHKPLILGILLELYNKKQFVEFDVDLSMLRLHILIIASIAIREQNSLLLIGAKLI